MQARQHRELREHLKRAGRTGALFKFRSFKKLVVNLGFFGHTQAIGHLDHADTVDEGFVVFVGLKRLPF